MAAAPGAGEGRLGLSIQGDNVDLLASSTPETVNAVASQAEALGTPLVCGNISWEAWYVNLGGNPQKPALKPKYTTLLEIAHKVLTSVALIVSNEGLEVCCVEGG